MDRNIIYKDYLQTSALVNANVKEKQIFTNLFEGVSPFNLFNIIGKNNLFVVGLILLILYSWFIRANISIGAVFGFLFLGFLFYLYYRYKFYDIKAYTEDKQQKENFLAQILSGVNIYPIEGALSFNNNYLNLRRDEMMNYLYFNPAVVDFYYNNRAFIDHSYLNFARSLQTINAMTFLHNDIIQGVNDRGAQYEQLEFLRKRCMNFWQAIIYDLPSTCASNTKFQESLKILGEITQNYIDSAQIKIKEQNALTGMNMSYYQIVKSGPKPSDVGTYGYNDHFDFFT